MAWRLEKISIFIIPSFFGVRGFLVRSKDYKRYPTEFKFLRRLGAKNK
jgi:hypothetical protein